MSQIEATSRVLEDGVDALVAGGEAQIVGDDEFASLDDLAGMTPKVEEDKDKKPAPAAAAPAAPAAAAGEDDDVPAEFKGKSKKDIVRMYQEAHQTIGRQGSELGEMRKYADVFIREGMARRAPPQQPQQPQQPVKVDESEVFAKPIETINKLVEQHPLIQELRRTMGHTAAESAQARMAQAQARFQAAHPDAADILHNPEFRQWVNASPKRRQMMNDANQRYDFDAGDEVFSTWKELTKVRAPQAPAAAAAPAAGSPSEAEVSAAAATLARARAAKGQSAAQAAAAQAAAAPTNGASAAPSKGGKKLYRRADIIRLMIDEPERYEALSPEIQKAYAENRVR